jgi:hypothetical protein
LSIACACGTPLPALLLEEHDGSAIEMRGAIKVAVA